MTYETIQLRNSVVVRPTGCLGTCGWINGVGWEAKFFTTLKAAQRWISQQ